MSEDTIMSAPEVVETPVEAVTQEPVSEASVETQTESPAVTNEPAVEFISTLSEDLQGMSNLKDFKTADDLAKSYVELQRMVGNSVRIPAEDASPEAKKEFLDKIKGIDGVLLKDDESLLNKLGKPETSDMYNLDEVMKDKDLTGVPHFDEELEDFKKIAHEAGLTNEQASKLVDMRVQTISAQESRMEEDKEQASAELKKTWGEDFDNRLNGAKRVAKVYSEKYGDHMNALINSPAGNNPALLNMMSELAVVYKEKGHEGMSGAHFGLTPEGAANKIAEKKADVGFMRAYMDDMAPGHKQAVAELQKLYGIANS
jgi:hypothetical protein